MVVHRGVRTGLAAHDAAERAAGAGREEGDQDEQKQRKADAVGQEVAPFGRGGARKGGRAALSLARRMSARVTSPFHPSDRERAIPRTG
jgi:hypothetical protein